MKKFFIAALLLSLTCGVCHAQRQNSGVKEFEAECLGVEGDGSQTIRAYGFGKDKDDAVEQAQKNAVYAVIFKGITKGSGCNMKPLLTEVNAREKYEDYFKTMVLLRISFLWPTSVCLVAKTPVMPSDAVMLS